MAAACTAFTHSIVLHLSRNYAAYSAVSIEAHWEEDPRSRLGQQNTAKGQGESC